MSRGGQRKTQKQKERKKIEEAMLMLNWVFGEKKDNPSFCQLNYARIAGFHFTNPNLSLTK